MVQMVTRPPKTLIETASKAILCQSHKAAQPHLAATVPLILRGALEPTPS